MKLEIIGFDIQSCIAAQNAGANRIELCGGPGEGGTTPSYGFIKAAREKLNIDLYVMIRSRGGDFLYSSEEFEIMKADIAICKESGCDGIVFGILTQDGKVDKKRCKELIDLAFPLEATFHRAFDRVVNPFEAMEDIIELGFERILTSGLVPAGFDGKQTISELISKSAERIIIMPGSGVNSENIISIAATSGAKELHSSASILAESKMEYQNAAMNESLKHVTVNEEEVKKMVGLLAEFDKKNESA